MFVPKVNRGPLSRSVCFPQSGSAATVSIATLMARRYRVTVPAHFVLFFFHVALLTKCTNPSSARQNAPRQLKGCYSLWFHQGCFFLCELVSSLGFGCPIQPNHSTRSQMLYKSHFMLIFSASLPSVNQSVNLFKCLEIGIKGLVKWC